MLRTSAPLIGALAVKIYLMAQHLDFLRLAVEHVLDVWCLIAIFEGTRRIRLRLTHWSKSKLLLIGTLWALFSGGENLIYLYITNHAGILKAPNPPVIGPEWGSNLPFQKRAIDSQALASAAIRSGQSEAKAFDLNGKFVPYCPTAEDIAAHARFLKAQSDLELQVQNWKRNAIQWLSSIVIAVALAFLASNPRHSKRIGFDS